MNFFFTCCQKYVLKCITEIMRFILPLLFLTVIKTQCLDSSAAIVTHTTTRVPGTYILYTYIFIMHVLQ